MKRYFSICLFSFSVLLVTGTCGQQQSYAPAHLRKLTESELLNRFKERRLLNESVVFKDSTGMIIPRAEIAKLPHDLYFGDHFVDSAGETVEIVVRRATSVDKALIAKMEALAKELTEDEPVEIIDIDCSRQKEILEDVYNKDQSGRSEGNFQNDKTNQQIVASIIEHCGFPTIQEHGYTSVQAVFLVIQHAGKNYRVKYFPLVQQAVERGDLQASIVALMEDRMLMDQGKKQKYGSQVIKQMGSDKWEVHPIEDPANVNRRRAQVGLEPLEDYLLRFDIVYKN